VIKLSFDREHSNHGDIQLPYSKSTLNRLIIIGVNRYSAINKACINDDIQAMLDAVNSIKRNYPIDAKEAGTVLRFSLAKAANTPGYENSISGSPVLMKRPISPLIDALNALGADVSLQENLIHVKGKKLNGGQLFLDEQVSSQFISALMLIGHQMKTNLELHWSPNQSSISYVHLTADIMNKAGILTEQKDSGILIHKDTNFISKAIAIERDWSAASFFFALTLLKKESPIHLLGLEKNSSQSEQILFKDLLNWGLLQDKKAEVGVHFQSNSGSNFPSIINFKNYPDAALNILMAAALQKTKLRAKGLNSLNLKESKRLDLLCETLELLQVKVSKKNEDEIEIDATHLIIPHKLKLKCYNDHRIAMAWALIATQSSIQLVGHTCVTKSFPYFWEEIRKVGFNVL